MGKTKLRVWDKKIKRPDKYTPGNFKADDLLFADKEVLRKANERLERKMARDKQVVGRIGFYLAGGHYDDPRDIIE